MTMVFWIGGLAIKYLASGVSGGNSSATKAMHKPLRIGSHFRPMSLNRWERDYGLIGLLVLAVVVVGSLIGAVWQLVRWVFG